VPSGTVPRVHRRALRIAVVAIAGAALVALGGIVDHAVKQRRMNSAQEHEWYCLHQGIQCGRTPSADIEAAWNRREPFEIGAAVALVVVGVAATAVALGSRQPA
jgi:hypothetical protein